MHHIDETIIIKVLIETTQIFLSVQLFLLLVLLHDTEFIHKQFILTTYIEAVVYVLFAW